MKRILALSVVIGVVGFSGDIAAKKTVSDVDHEQNCRQLMGTARVIMTAKQNGLPIDKALSFNDQALKKNPNNKNLHDLTNKIIRDAYAQPSYSTPSIKAEQLNEFSAKYYLGCMEMYEE